MYQQMEQAAIIKKAHPDLPVFVYSGFGFAAGFNNGTWPALDSVVKDPKGSPYRDFFLQALHLSCGEPIGKIIGDARALD